MIFKIYYIHMKYSLIYVLSTFLAMSNINAQDPRGSSERSAPEGIISGVINEKDNGPLEFASIALYSIPDSSLVTGGISGPDGSFKLDQIRFGSYYIVANYIGYEKNIIENVNVRPDNQELNIGTINLSLASQNIDEVEIIADQAHVEYKIDRKIVNVGQDINASTGSAADVLRNTPSVSVDIEGNVSLRGSGSFTVLIDGKPSALTGSDALQQIPASAIRNIEIITNPSAKYDPDGMAGIINIVSKKNALDGISGIFNATVGTGDKYSGDFLLSYKTDKFTMSAGANYNDRTYAGEITSVRQFLGENARYVETQGDRYMYRGGYELKGEIDYFINDNNTISLSAEGGKHEFSFGGNQKLRSFDDSLSYDIYSVNDNLSAHGGNYLNLTLSYTKKFQKQGHELTGYAQYRIREGDDSDEQNEYPADSDFIIDNTDIPDRVRSFETGTNYNYRAQIDYTLPISEKGKYEAGYQLRMDDDLENYLFQNYDIDQNEWINNPDYSTQSDFFRNIQALYSTFSNSIGDYQYQFGLRAEYTDRRIKNQVTGEISKINRIDFFPTVHLSRQFRNDHQLMASYSRRINRPRGWYLEPFLSYMDAYTLRRGDPGLSPEYMNSYEIGYQKTIGKSFIAFETYYKNTENKIEMIQTPYDPENAITLMTYANVSKDNSLGAELMINYGQQKWLDLNTSFSLYRYWLEGEINDESIDANSNNWNTRLNATFNITTKTRLQLSGVYSGPSVTAQGKQEAYFYNSLAFRQDLFDRKLSVTLQLRDIFGTAVYESYSYGPGFSNYMKRKREPRVFMISLSYKINNYKPEQRGNMNRNEGMGEDQMF